MSDETNNEAGNPAPTVPTSAFNRIWSQAFIDVFSNNPSNYQDIYSSYLGVRTDPPTPDTYDGYIGNEWVAYSDLRDSSPIKQGIIRIGTYVHAPYSYFNSDGKLIGFEVEMAEQIVAVIGAHYRKETEADNIPELQIEWTYIELDDSIMLWDGSDNEKISTQLAAGLRTEDNINEYDMVFSGIMTRPSETYENAFPNATFYVSALYTGMDNFTGAPVSGNLEDVGKWLASCSKIIGDEITITNTNHMKGVEPEEASESELNKPGETQGGQQVVSSESQQQQAANMIVDSVIRHGGQASSHRRLIPGLMDAINYKTVHVYVGDLIQIEFVAAHADYPVNLIVQLLPDAADPIMTLSPYTAAYL